MTVYFKALTQILKNYNIYFFPILYYEICFYIRYPSEFNRFKYLNSRSFSDSIPCSLFTLNKIVNFINDKKIKKICDLGSGYGKILYYLGDVKKYFVDGIEFDEEIFFESLVLKKSNINIFNKNILKFNYNEKKYDLLIVNDPLKKISDFKFLTKKILEIKKKTYLVFINIDKSKAKEVFKYFKILDFCNISNRRNIIFCVSD